ncbi:CHAT domain-containing protein, partial [candidate division KSB1 bacterium]|nr:CHAT domain-containing protein [candidate division KSB1 bacterium]
SVGDFDRARESLQQALELHRKIEDVPGEAVTLNTIGQTYLETDRAFDAKNHFQQALVLHQKMGEQGGEATALGNLGSAHSLLADSSSAVEFWNKGIHLSRKIEKLRLQGWLHKQLGNFYLEHKETDKAAKAYEQGLAITEGLFDPELRWGLYFGQGRLNELIGDPERAYYSYRAAIKDIESIRSKATIEEFKSGIMHNHFEVYEAIVSVLVQLGRAEEAFEYSERARARSLLDKIGNAAIGVGEGNNHELIEKERSIRTKIKTLRSLILKQDENSTTNIRGTATEKYREILFNMQQEYQRTLIDLKLQNPEYSSLITIEPTPLNKIQPLLDDSSLLLEYFISDNQILIFVLSKEKLNVVKVAEGRESLRGKILLFQGTAVQNIKEGKPSEPHWMKPLQGLFKLLIEPVHIQGLLAGKNHLIFAPQELLHYLPFHALVSRIDTSALQQILPRFLIEDYLISYTPSASVLKFCKKNKSSQINKQLLLAPKPAILPFSEQEVTKISSELGPGAEYWLGEKATESLLKKQCANYDLLHFATTAHFNKASPLFSKLDLAPSETDDGCLDVFETFGLNLKRTNLVTLSACETALGSGYTSSFPQGDDLVSLTRAFLYAGTPSVVASLWEVYDKSTALFMFRFYLHLKTRNKVKALALTQRDMIGGHLSGDKDYQHPYFWAPFVLIGDWEK